MLSFQKPSNQSLQIQALSADLLLNGCLVSLLIEKEWRVGEEKLVI